MARPKIGQVLLKLGFIDEMRLSAALAHQKQWGTPLARAVMELRFCSLEQVMRALSQQTGLPLVDLSREPLGPKLAALLSAKVAEQHHVVPLRLEGARSEVLVIAIAAPADIGSLDAVQAVSGKQRLKALLAPDDSIEHALKVIYKGEQGRLPAVFAAVVDAREQEFDPGAKPAPEPEAPAAPQALPAPQTASLSVSLTLTLAGRRVIKNAAEHHGISEAGVVERVMEAWAARQRGG